MKNKETEAPAGMRLYSPLVGAFYDSEDHCTSMDGYALSGYDWTIKKALEKDWIQESRAGLAEYLDEGPLKEKIVSMHPVVEVWNYCLWGVLKVECREELSLEETERLKSEWYGQMADGWGEGFVQQDIECEEGCRLCVDFGAASRNRIQTEQELKGIRAADQNQPVEQESPRMGMA